MMMMPQSQQRLQWPRQHLLRARLRKTPLRRLKRQLKKRQQISHLSPTAKVYKGVHQQMETLVSRVKLRELTNNEGMPQNHIKLLKKRHSLSLLTTLQLPKKQLCPAWKQVRQVSNLTPLAKRAGSAQATLKIGIV